MNFDAAKKLPLVTKLALQAGAEIMRLRQGPLATERKEDKSIVTEADLASDKIIKQALEENFPDHAILTEETGLKGNPNSEWVWIVDPLDGTKAYAKNIPGYSVMIGLLHRNQPYLGVVYDPLEDHVYEAVRGEGCWHTHQGQRKKISVSTRDDYSKMPLVISTGFPEDKLAQIQSHFPSPQVDPINSVGIKVGLLVRQVGDYYVNHHGVSYWDTCAPQIILEEAGGIFTSMDGSRLTYNLNQEKLAHAQPTLASNNQKHQELARILAPILL